MTVCGAAATMRPGGAGWRPTTIGIVAALYRTASPGSRRAPRVTSGPGVIAGINIPVRPVLLSPLRYPDFLSVAAVDPAQRSSPCR